MTLTFDLDLQTRPSERPNTPSDRIWRKSVQRFLEIFHTLTKKYFAKNRTLSSSLPAVKNKLEVDGARAPVPHSWRRQGVYRNAAYRPCRRVVDELVARLVQQFIQSSRDCRSELVIELRHLRNTTWLERGWQALLKHVTRAALRHIRYFTPTNTHTPAVSRSSK